MVIQVVSTKIHGQKVKLVIIFLREAGPVLVDLAHFEFLTGSYNRGQQQKLDNCFYSLTMYLTRPKFLMKLIGSHVKWKWLIGPILDGKIYAFKNVKLGWNAYVHLVLPGILDMSSSLSKISTYSNIFAFY